jgi:hypothetical protein
MPDAAVLGGVLLVFAVPVIRAVYFEDGSPVSLNPFTVGVQPNLARYE